MIAGRLRHHAALAMLFIELQQSVPRAAFLEASGALQIVELTEHATAGELRKRNRFRAGSQRHAAGDALPRGDDVGKSKFVLRVHWRRRFYEFGMSIRK